MKLALPVAPTATPAKAPNGKPEGVIVTPSRQLFGERRELVIEHAGSLYRLRITQNNRLILTK